MKAALLHAMEHAVESIERLPLQDIHLFHHNDTDGLTSGAILTRAFVRKGYAVSRIALEKPYPAVLKKIFCMEGALLVFADFAGRIDPLLADMNNGKNLIIILDHHVAEESGDPKVLNLDPDLFGLKGDRDIAASTTCFLFAKVMDEKNVDLASLAALGAVGDEFFVDGELVSENLNAALEAVEQGRLEIDESRREGKRYIFRTSKGNITGDAFEEYLDVLGGAGYYKNGPDIGVQVCLEGFFPQSDAMVENLKLVKDRIFTDEINRLENGEMHHTPHIQWFHVHNRFSPMGVKMVGAFCDAVRRMDFIDKDKYIAGFQAIPDVIPGFGNIQLNQAKISMRVPPAMEKDIRTGKRMGLNVLLPEATRRLGGFSDACHSLTAATTVDVGKEEQVIGEMEKILGK